MKKDRWFLPTNIPNLMMFLTQGLICSPEDSLIYSPNLLEVAPGWIPLQKNKIEILINENIDFNPSIIIEINLTKIKGEVFDVSTGEFTLIKQAAEQNCMFIAAPLPLTCIDKIIFKDKIAQDKFISDCKNLYANIPLLNFTFKVDKKLFPTEKDKDTSAPSLPFNEFKTPVSHNVHLSYKEAYAYGGALLNLFYNSKNGTLSTKFYNDFLELNKQNAITSQSYVELLFNDIVSHKDNETLKKLYEHLVEATIDGSSSFKQSTITFLQSSKWEGDALKRTSYLADMLTSFEYNPQYSNSEMLMKAKSKFEKLLLVLFLYEDSDELIDIPDYGFTEEEHILFSLFFGLRDSFVKIPKFIREFENLQPFVSHNMAMFLHNRLESKTTFKSPKKSISLVTMLTNRDFTEWFEKENRLVNCFLTKVLIPQGKYNIEITKKGLEISVAATLGKLTTTIQKDNYFNSISKLKLTDYNKYLTKYEKL